MTLRDDPINGTDEGTSPEDRMTDAQRVYLDTLSDQTGEPTPAEHLSRDEAAKKIKELQEEAGYDTSTDDLDEP